MSKYELVLYNYALLLDTTPLNKDLRVGVYIKNNSN